MMNRRLLINVGAWCVMACAWLLLNQKPRRRKRLGATNFYRARKTHGAYTTLVPHLRRNPQMHFTYFRMPAERLEELLCIIGPHMHQQNCSTRLSPDERLCITLRYLASGLSMTALTFEYRVSKQTVSNVVEEVCHLLWNHLFPRYMEAPGPQKWNEIADDMFKLWDVPNCVGAIGGRHVKAAGNRQPGQAIDMVLMATCDAYKCFTIIDVNCHGRISDGAVFSTSLIGSKLRNCTLDLPKPAPLPGTAQVMPHYFAAEVFPLSPNIMRPYPTRKGLPQERQVFNYRLSRARRLIDNAVGILAARWHIFQAPINADLGTIKAMLKGTCVLHNFLMMGEMALPSHARSYCPPTFADREVDGVFVQGEWRDAVNDGCALQPIGRVGSNNFTKVAEYKRCILLDYFVTNGAIPRQDACISQDAAAADGGAEKE